MKILVAGASGATGKLVVAELLNRDDVTPYSVFPSPIRSALFNPGQTSRNNVAHFMAELIYDDELWRNWKGRMPVIYNEDPKK